MNEIQYLTGDATCPVGNDNKIICHICNDIGIWGEGFVIAISKRWKYPEIVYHNIFWTTWEYGERLPLGNVTYVPVEENIHVANMIGQYGTSFVDDIPPIRYDALKLCLMNVCMKAKELNASVHMPKIGCGIAGGKWESIEPIIQETLIKNGVSVYVYMLPNQK